MENTFDRVQPGQRVLLSDRKYGLLREAAILEKSEKAIKLKWSSGPEQLPFWLEKEYFNDAYELFELLRKKP